MGESTTTTSYIAITLAVVVCCCCASLPHSQAHSQATAELPRPIHLPLEDIEDVEDTPEDRQPRSQRPSLIDIAVQASAREGLNAIAEFYGRTLPDIVRNGQLLDDNHPAALLSKFSAPDEDSERREMAGFATVLATKAFRKNYKYINELARQAHTPKISLRRTALEGLCPPREPPTCMPAARRYRTHDGTCNSQRRPRWGAAQMPFNRFLPPEYGDGVDSVRSAVDGGPLSSSRFVSLLVHGAKEGEAGLTLMTVQWGQLLDHDLTATAQPRSINGSVPSCCGNKDFHPSCFPIKVPLDDPWLAPLKVRCLEFLRSAPAQRRDCVLSWREQTNQATSYIDASPIYSNSAKASDNARVFRNGLLIYGRGPPETDVCQRGALESKCIRAGDGRSSEQPGLLAMHHVWVGEHNRIASQLSEMNLHWSDEKIYQETRRIVGAMFQHITYREFLPVVLGREVCKLFDLQLLDSGYYEGYDPKVNPTVANSFAAAAFRFGHSLVQNSYMRCDHHHNVIGNNVSLHEEFQRGDIGSAGSLHRLLRGMASQRTLKRDEFITPELTNHLFQTPGFPFGLDLAAINIQRGRDHGVPAYTAWRVPCGLSPINSWDDMVNVVGPESARRIGHAYRSVHDVDLFVGGIAERPVVGGLVGPTFACIIAQQFSNSRKGDRFWYENGQFESSFTPAQLHAIRRVSLAQVLCRTVGGGTFQPHIFLPPDTPGNARLPCGAGSLEPIDLSAWLEQDPLAVPPPSPTPAFAVESPERVFDIMPPLSPLSSDTADALTAMQVDAENKAGFPKRGHPFEGAAAKPQHIQFIPNSSIGFQRPQKVVVAAAKNVTKVNNKLDIKIKTGPSGQRRPTVTVLNGISNKLDSQKQRVTASGGGHRQRLGSTTRRTIVVNNVPIELRSATETTTDGLEASKKPPKGDKKKKKKKNTKTNQTSANLKVEARHGSDDEQDEQQDKQHEDSTNIKDTTDPTDIKDITDPTHIKDTTDSTDPTTDMDEQEAFDIFFALTEPVEAESSTPETSTDTDGLSMEETIPKIATDKDHDSLDRFEMTQDIDPMTNSPPDTHEHVRVQRKLTDSRVTDSLQDADETDRSPRASKGGHRSKTGVKTNSTGPTTTKAFVRNRIVNVTVGNLPALLHGHRNSGSPKTSTAGTPKPTRVTPKPTRASSSTTTIDRTAGGNSSTTNPTLRNIELRQYQTVSGGYTRPHKVIVDGPNSDQYEIEINIRQTNKSPPARPSASHADYTTAQSVGLLPQDPYYGYDRYPVQAKPPYPTSTLQPPYYQPAPPTLSSAQLGYTPRTKPPTVIYLNDHDIGTTTRQPGFLQNLFAYGQQRPTYPSGPEAQKERPSSPGAVLPSYLSQPIASAISQAAALLPNGGGSVHAASTAVSNGPYGSIVGVASANGADSTFSFNIRPRPQATAKPIPSGGGYDPLQSQTPPNYDYHNHDYHSHHQDHHHQDHHHSQHHHLQHHLAQPHHQSEAYYDKPAHSHAAGSSPFSTAIKNPSIPGYYSRTQAAASEYDEYLGRTLQPVLTNVTDSSGLPVLERDYPYDEYDDDGVGSGELPEDNGLLGNLFKVKSPVGANDSTTNCQLDDNYVLPVLNSPLGAAVTEVVTIETTSETTTNFPDVMSKHLHNDIVAEDETDTTGQRLKVESRTDEPIAFAPIRILTQPERPDHWINVDVSSKEVLLPVPPIETGESSEVAAEIPRPIMGLGNIRLTKARPAGDVAEVEAEPGDF